MASNEHYENLIKNLTSDSDSIFEPCEVLDFDTKTLQAKVLGLRSKETKENVIVMFPSFYLGTGVITFPVKRSKGIIFVGPQNTSYMLPAQYFLPTKTAVNNVAVGDASPGQFDFLLKLENLEPGEILLRTLSHAQLFLSNSGEIELLTKKLNRLSLNDIDGSLETVIERERKYMGYSFWYNGAHETDEDVTLYEHHMHEEIYEEIPNWDEEDVTLQQAESLNTENVSMDNELQTPTQHQRKYTEQKVNVYNKKGNNEFGSQKILSDVDQQELFLLKELFGTASGDVIKNTKLRWIFSQSKEGAIKVFHHKQELNEGYTLKMDFNKINLLMEDAHAKNDTTITKNGFTSLLKQGSSRLNASATPQAFDINVGSDGSIVRTFLHLEQSYGKLGHIRSDGKEMSVTVSASGPDSNRRSLAAPQKANVDDGFSFTFGEANIKVAEEQVVLKYGENEIKTSGEEVVIKHKDGSTIEMKDGDIIHNGKSFNELVALVNKLAKLNGLEDEL